MRDKDWWYEFITSEEIRERIDDVFIEEQKLVCAGGVGSTKSFPVLREFGTDLTAQAIDGKLDPVLKEHNKLNV